MSDDDALDVLGKNTRAAFRSRKLARQSPGILARLRGFDPEKSDIITDSI